MTYRALFFQPVKYRRILKLAGPLILSQSGLVMMQFVDAMFLAWFAPEAIAASGTGGMVSWLFASLIIGIVGYTSVITSNNIGAKNDRDIGSAVWQGIHISIVAGLITAFLSIFTEPFFLMVGHGDAIAKLESDYLNVLMLGSVCNYAQMALGGFFSGRGDNIRLMLAQMAGQLLNVFLDWVMIFGHLGCPRMGVTGAALATVIGTALTLVILFALFFQEKHRKRFLTLNWRPNFRLCRHLLKFGVATGVQLCIDAGLWTVFLILIGRIGTVELAATTIAFRINSLAFTPVLGIGRAMSTVVGQSHGAREHDETVSYIVHGCVVSQSWMTLVSLSYWLFTAQYLGCFRSDSGQLDFQLVYDTGYNLLRFVSVYCLVDGINITMSFSLHAVGDTNWPTMMVAIFTGILIAVQIIGVNLGGGLYFVWSCATGYILLMPIMWITRLRQGKWKQFVVATRG